MNYSTVFGTKTVPPAGEAYRYILLTQTTQFNWPVNYEGDDYIAAINTVEAVVDSLSIKLPDASVVSPGMDALFHNTGTRTFFIKDALGADITSVAPGVAKYVWLIANGDVPGVWRSITFGAGTSSADAAALAGMGMVVGSGRLNLGLAVTVTSSSLDITLADRAKVINAIGGSIQINLPPADSLGNNFFFAQRNNGEGTVTLVPQTNERIDDLVSLALAPGESAFIFCSGDAFYSIGYGRSTQFQFTKLVKDVSAGGTFTLTAAEASSKLLQFTGTPATNVTIIVPSVVAIYYLQNSYNGQRTLTLKTLAGTGVVFNNTDRVIAYCDGVNVVSAQSASIGSNVSIIDGSAGAPSINFSSDSDTGIYRAGTNIFGIAAGGLSVATFGLTNATFRGSVTATQFNGALNGPSTGITGILPISQGGTGGTDAATARAALGAQAALGYTPYSANNPAGFIAGISAGMVNAALGYTPARESNTVKHGDIAGPWNIASLGVSKAYNDQICIREPNFGGATMGFGPRLSFYWGGVAASQIGIGRDGWIEIVDNPGTGYGNFRAQTVMELSDERQKTNWSQLPPDYIERLAGIEKYGTFDWIDGGHGLGVGAQSLQKILPRAIHVDDDRFLTVHHGGFAAVSVVELAKRIMQLTSRIKELEDDNANG
jgi:hypothetical protein